MIIACFLSSLPSFYHPESVFKSMWLKTPSEWTQSELSDQFEMLHSIVAVSNKALDKAQVAGLIRSSLEAEITIQTPSVGIKSTLLKLTKSQSTKDIEFPLCDYFRVSKTNIQSHFDEGFGATVPNVQEEATIQWHGEYLPVRTVVTPVSESTGHSKCPRCWKWVCSENEELCSRCRQVELALSLRDS